jgi:two-component system cell cycle sensor histidine kinase/response regulator CckA
MNGGPILREATAPDAMSGDERLYFTILNSLGAIIWEADGRTFRFTFVSPQAERILGFPTKQWLEEPDFWRRHTHPDDVEWCTRFCMDTSSTGRDHQFQYRMIAADGRVVWLQDVVTAKQEEDGSIRLSGIMLDITERKETEAAIRVSEARYRSLVAASAQVVWTTDRDGAMRQTREWCALTGQSEDEASGWGWLDAVHADDRERAAQTINHALTAKRGYGIEYRLRTRDGSVRHFSARAAPVLDPAGHILEWVGAAADVTEHRNLQDQFTQSLKMEAIGQLAGGVAHDFNNLLTVITGCGELLLEDLPAQSPSRELVQEMKRAGERAATLTRQLLAFSRKQLLAPRVLDLNEIISGSEKMLRRLVGENTEVITRLDPDLWPVMADAAQIDQMLMNLVMNACDAMTAGGRLVLETRNAELDKAWAQAHLEARSGPHVLLSVTDSGTGMSEEVKRHLFEPFFTTKAPGRGSGLGLATVYGIVKQSGGVIEVDSEPGEGTTVRVYLPVTTERASTGRSMPGLPTPGGSEVLLVVEDEEAVRSLTRRVLTRGGYHVIEAREGREAMLVASEFPDHIDLLVTDVVMPEMGGVELARDLTALRPRLKVLFVSGYTDDAILRHGVLDHQVSFLQKPFTIDGLLRIVRDVLDS